MTARRAVAALLVLATTVALLACTGGGRYYRGRSMYGGHYGRGPWWGYNRTIIVDPCRGNPGCGGYRPDEPIAVPLPEYPDIPEPMPMPEAMPMPMPDMGMGMPDIPMDMGGFDL